MHSDDPAEMVVQPLQKKQSFESATPPTKRQLSFPSSNPSPPTNIVRKLSFGETAGSSEQVVPATPEEQPEPDNSSQRAVAPAIPDKEVSSAQQGAQKPATPEEQPEPDSSSQHAVAPAIPDKEVSSAQQGAQKPTPLPQASATTLIGVSGDERFRITYEARQLLHSVHSQDEIVGSVGKGLLVVPGQWARLSNISEGGTWLKTESFQVGDKTVVRKQSKLTEMRSDWQTQTRDSHSVWKVGPKEIVTAVVHAQEFFSDKNLKDQCVLRAAVRNGLLVYRPNPQTGKLEELMSQKWAQELELEMGTRGTSLSTSVTDSIGSTVKVCPCP